MSTFSVRTANLRAINSMTKYPSVPTYHGLDKSNGSLTDEVTAFSGRVTLTEKVDGTNGRIIGLPDGTYLLGSREDLWYAQGDVIRRPDFALVDTLAPIADRLDWRPTTGVITAFYFEVYGGQVGKHARNYGTARTGARLFDVVHVDNADEVLGWPIERIASWRQAGGQQFLGAYALAATAAMQRLETVPHLDIVDAASLPTDLESTRAWLAEWLPHTQAALDGAPGRAEGIVLRSDTRSVIAKARFEDYERTLRRRDYEGTPRRKNGGR